MLIEGIDTATWQGSINWSRVAASGRGFAWTKATEGNSYVDPTYAANVAGARAAGVAVGAYDFCQPSAAPGAGRAEAKWFLDHARPQPGDLWPALDVEVSNGLTPAQMRVFLTDAATYIHDSIGVWPFIYTSPAFWGTSPRSPGHVGNSTFAADLGCPLWIAHWGVSRPTVPASNWGGHGWAAWQYSNSGSVPGISARVDLDRAPATLVTAYTLGGTADMNPLVISNDADSMAQLKVGTQLYNPDGSPLVKVSVAGAPRLSPYEVQIGSTRYRVVPVTTGGKVVQALVRLADCVQTPVVTTDCSALVTAATDPLNAQIAELEAQLATAAADERKRIADAEAARIEAL